MPRLLLGVQKLTIQFWLAVWHSDVGGSVTSVNTNATDISSLLMNGGAQSGTLIFTGATPWGLLGIGTNTITLNGASATVDYASASAQAVLAKTYTNLILDGSSGVKSIATGTSVGGNLTSLQQEHLLLALVRD